jgi:hypothetical protein
MSKEIWGWHRGIILDGVLPIIALAELCFIAFAAYGILSLLDMNAERQICVHGYRSSYPCLIIQKTKDKRDRKACSCLHDSDDHLLNHLHDPRRIRAILQLQPALLCYGPVTVRLYSAELAPRKPQRPLPSLAMHD